MNRGCTAPASQPPECTTHSCFDTCSCEWGGSCETHDDMPEDDGLWDFGGHPIFPGAQS